MNNSKNKSIILFDGVCNLCNSSVNFIIKHDKKEQYLFASLQSDAAKEILLQFDIKKIPFDSILLIYEDKIYEKSTAAILISKHLTNGYQLLYGLIIVPKFIRDSFYSLVAKNRYNWFGKRQTCMIPSNEIIKRFL